MQSGETYNEIKIVKQPGTENQEVGDLVTSTELIPATPSDPEQRNEMLGQFSLNVGMENEIVADGGMDRKNNDELDNVYSYEDGMFSDIPMDKDW